MMDGSLITATAQLTFANNQIGLFLPNGHWIGDNEAITGAGRVERLELSASTSLAVNVDVVDMFDYLTPTQIAGWPVRPRQFIDATTFGRVYAFVAGDSLGTWAPGMGAPYVVFAAASLPGFLARPEILRAKYSVTVGKANAADAVVLEPQALCSAGIVIVVKGPGTASSAIDITATIRPNTSGRQRFQEQEEYKDIQLTS